MCLDPSLVTESLLLELKRYDNLVEEQVVRLETSDIRTISHLGQGAFCNVSLAVSRSTKKQLAVKSLGKHNIESTQQLQSAAIDLIMEAHYLSKLDHQNIIKLQGVSSATFSSSYAQEGRGYFLALDVMQDTLRERIPKWHEDKSSYDTKKLGLRKRLTSKRRKLNLKSMYHRIETAALGIAEAMQYIHGQGIIVRDLKPGNVGFHAETGNICLLDFGFARELSDCRDREICGTPRYMAPELLSGRGYSFKTDVYSFGIMLHEIASLEHSWRPTKRSISSHSEMLTACETLPKPSTENIPCPVIAGLIEDCISYDPDLRPSFEDICKTLKEALSSPTPQGRSGKASLKSDLQTDSDHSCSSLPDFFDDSVDDLFDLVDTFNSSV